MRNARLLAILLVAATVLVDLVAVSAVAGSHGFPPEWPHPALVVLVALAMSQVSLAAIWMGWGRTWLSWRTLILVLTIVVWSRLFECSVAPEELDDIATIYGLLLSAQCIGVLLPSCLARRAGIKLIQDGDVKQAREPDRVRRQWQFSLGYLLSWITVVAVSLGALLHAFDYRVVWRASTLLSPRSAVSPLAHAALALAALWTALGTGRPRLRGVALSLTTVGAIAAVHTLVEPSGGGRAYAAVCVLQVVWLLASLWVVRVAGYRIVRERRASLPDRS